MLPGLKTCFFIFSQSLTKILRIFSKFNRSVSTKLGFQIPSSGFHVSGLKKTKFKISCFCFMVRIPSSYRMPFPQDDQGIDKYDNKCDQRYIE